jgi:hypothetical protein
MLLRVGGASSRLRWGGGYPLPPWVRGVGGGCLSKIRKGGGGGYPLSDNWGKPGFHA